MFSGINFYLLAYVTSITVSLTCHELIMRNFKKWGKFE